MATRGRYITPKTSRFVQRIGKELIGIMGQSIIAYRIDTDIAVSDDKYAIYNETGTPVYKKIGLIPCIVGIDPRTTETFEDATFENKTRINVSFLRETLKHCNYMPNIGDVISYQGLFFEIDDTDDTKVLHGSPEFKYSVNVTAHLSRRDKYKIPIEPDF